MIRYLSLLLLFAALPAFAAEPLGKVEGIAGKVILYQQGRVRGESLRQPGSPLAEGDSLTTQRGGEARLAFVDGNRMILTENSTLLVKGRDAAEVKAGMVLLDIRKRGELKGFEVTSATVTIGVRGTRFAVSNAQGRVAVHLKKGKLAVKSASGGFQKHRDDDFADQFQQMKDDLRERFDADRERMQAQFDAAREHMAAGDIEFVEQIELEEGSSLTIEGNEAWVTPLGTDLDAEFARFENF